MAAVEDFLHNGDVSCKFTVTRMENENIEQLNEEIRNLEKLIRLTKERLERLNAQFGKERHPPALYLQEYEELANKIHELQTQLQDKQALIDSELEPPEPPPRPEPARPIYPTTPINLAPSSIGNGAKIESGGDMGALPSPSLSMKSPVGHVKAFLPNNQRTSVTVKVGKTLGEGLAKAMKLRDFDTEDCDVFDRTGRQFSWDDPMTDVAGYELTVVLKSNTGRQQRFPGVPNHNIVRKTFFSLTFCDVCHKFLLQGFRCQTCGYRLHQRCKENINPQCDTRNLTKQHYPRIYIEPINFMMAEKSLSAPDVNLPGAKEDVRQQLQQAYEASTNQQAQAAPYRYPMYKDKRHASDSCTKIVPHRALYKGQHSNTLNLPGRTSSHSPAGSPTDSTNHSPTTVGKQRPRARSVETDPGRRTGGWRDSNEDWEIPNEEIIFGPRIGSGSFGTVFKGHWHGAVAVKRLNVTNPTPAQLQAFKNEVAVLRKTRHLNVLLFMGCTSKPQLAIITQWCEGSSLYKHLHVDDIKFEMLGLLEIGRQTALGMDYLHAKSIIHRDLKSNNIFLTEDLTVKIGDFGLATVKTRWSGSHQFQQPTGSILWMAPEVIRMQEQNPYTFQSDVYAFGIVLYELMTGNLPYSHINNKDQILFMVGKGYLSPDVNKVRNDCPKALIRLMQDCCKYDRETRPLFPQILSSLEILLSSLPKIGRSRSEPIMNSSHTEDFEVMYMCASPKTPINSHYNQFSFLNY
ncbi:serine/threonine-protein kinase A-Raf-like isoform X2 [Ruditapes philippinarum]|uniref:serine/threonine-protein kinase A-Raf-like isoform X2 n=1 Tax=Ruditapes philippinarum TaxID=129788 RepID=UPI00295B6E52|nr:serine/threonine-protein kinase A-Raf-like isoform X2 [Ruditapes philippinarum]